MTDLQEQMNLHTYMLLEEKEELTSILQKYLSKIKEKYFYPGSYVERICVYCYIPYYSDGEQTMLDTNLKEPEIEISEDCPDEEEANLVRQILEDFSKINKKAFKICFPDSFICEMLPDSFTFNMEFTDHE